MCSNKMTCPSLKDRAQKLEPLRLSICYLCWNEGFYFFYFLFLFFIFFILPFPVVFCKQDRDSSPFI